MGIRELLGRASGPPGFGSAFGRSVVENGLGIGKTLYLGHGRCKSGSDGIARIFENSERMIAAGYELYCPDVTNRPAMEDSSALSVHSRTIGIALATHLAIFCSRFFKDEDNKSAFNRSLGQSTSDELHRMNCGVTVELFKKYTYMSLPAPLKLVNKEAPGRDDLLGFYLEQMATNISPIPLGVC
jgi:hypothetical protein